MANFVYTNIGDLYTKEVFFMALSIRDILLLDFFNGKPVHTRVLDFQYSTYGKDANSKIQDLCDEGWIRHSRPQETVNMLPDKALSDFLKHHELNGEGTHVELVRRVIENIPENEYAHAVPKVFIATSDGQKEMARNMAYILNVKSNYGLTEGEIGEAQRALTEKGNSFTSNDVLWRVFQQKLTIFSMAGEWTKLRNMYFTMANFCIHCGRNQDALSYFFLVFFMDLSGMENRNVLCRYENLFPTQKGILILINQLRQEAHMNLLSAKTMFLSSVARLAPRLPFSYFSPQVMGNILLDRLDGKSFDRLKYISLCNTPDPSSASYHYDAAEKTIRTSAKSGPGLSAPLTIQRTISPSVPPVFRLPDFTPVKPFRPSIPNKEKTKNEPPASEQQPLKNIQRGKKRRGCFLFIMPMILLLSGFIWFFH